MSALRDNSLTKKQVHKVVLVGGYTCIRYNGLLQGTLQILQSERDYGAVVQGAILGGSSSATGPAARRHSSKIAGGVMTVLLPRNSTIPTKKVFLRKQLEL